MPEAATRADKIRTGVLARVMELEAADEADIATIDRAHCQESWAIEGSFQSLQSSLQTCLENQGDRERWR